MIGETRILFAAHKHTCHVGLSHYTNTTLPPQFLGGGERGGGGVGVRGGGGCKRAWDSRGGGTQPEKNGFV